MPLEDLPKTPQAKRSRSLDFATELKIKHLIEKYIRIRFQFLVGGKIAPILSDNASQFAKYFNEACKRLKITHIYTRVKTAKDNAVNERFNRTLQEEFMKIDEYFEPYLTETNLVEANRLLTEWLIFYNFTRPHQSLDLSFTF